MRTSSANQGFVDFGPIRERLNVAHSMDATQMVSAQPSARMKVTARKRKTA